MYPNDRRCTIKSNRTASNIQSGCSLSVFSDSMSLSFFLGLSSKFGGTRPRRRRRESPLVLGIDPGNEGDCEEEKFVGGVTALVVVAVAVLVVVVIGISISDVVVVVAVDDPVVDEEESGVLDKEVPDDVFPLVKAGRNSSFSTIRGPSGRILARSRRTV